MSVPRLSVILPVYNGSAFLAEAMESVLNQTFRDFELLVIDDASTDGSAAVAEQFGDPRVRVIRQEANRRLPATLNHGLDLARGEWVARMDADDICHPQRFARQVAFLEAHPDHGVVGSWSEDIDEYGKPFPMGGSDHPVANEDFAEAIAEGATMVRVGTALFGRRE